MYWYKIWVSSMRENTWYLFFESFLHFPGDDTLPCFFEAENCSCAFVPHFCMHFFARGHLGCVHNMAVVMCWLETSWGSWTWLICSLFSENTIQTSIALRQVQFLPVVLWFPLLYSSQCMLLIFCGVFCSSIFFSCFCEERHWKFDGNCSKSVDFFWQYGHLYILILPIYEPRGPLHLLATSSFTVFSVLVSV